MLIVPAAVWNPWRLIVLDRLIRPLPVVVIAASASTLLVVAGFLGLRGRGPQVVAGHLVVRTRQRWLSRQGDASIANCATLGVLAPGAVQFTGSTSVSIATDDQTSVVVQFDPNTLVSTARPDC
jgi:hypothetical protein